MKPQEIIDLEKEIGVELKQVENEEKLNHKTYLLNKNGQVIGLSLKLLKLDNIPITLLYKIKYLEILDLGFNNIIQFPDSFDNLINLKKLNLRENRLTKFPNFIANLINLQKLSLGENKITEIPDLIGNLVNLVELDLKDNQLSQIPYSLTNLINLAYFFINDNPICQNPEYEPFIAKTQGSQIFKLTKLFAYLNEKQGIKTHTSVWEMSEELQTIMKQFLEGFVDFAQKFYGEKPHFEVRRIAVGLELEVRTTPTLTIEQIDEALALYVSGSFTEGTTLEQRELIRQLQEERFVLKMRLERILDQKQFLERENNELRLDIQYFKGQNHQLLQIVQNQQHQVEIKPISTSLQSEIRDLIGENRWEKVFEKLNLHFKNQNETDLLDQLIDCKSRWNTSKDKFNAGLINEENHNLALGKIRQTLLDLAKKIG